MSVFIVTDSAFAKKDQSQSFVDEQFTELETTIKDNYPLEEIARLQSQVVDIKEVREHTNPMMKIYIVSLWMKQGYQRQAYAVLETLAYDAPYRDLVAYYKGTLLIEKNDMKQAYMYLDELGAKYPTDPDFVFFKSRFHAQAKNYVGAIEALNVNIKNNRKKGKSYLQRGLLQLLVFDYDDSMKDLKNSLRYLDKDETYYRQMANFQIGLIYLKHLNKAKKASSYFDKGRALDPNSQLVQELAFSLKN